MLEVKARLTAALRITTWPTLSRRGQERHYQGHAHSVGSLKNNPYLTVVSKMISSTETVTQGTLACFSAARG